jgi:RhtB (resistance to homoserine/threonine) family protein
MDFALPLATLAIVHLLAVMSPGQSFLLVSRTALSSGRPAALAATLGMGLGVLPWAIGAMLGLALLFQQAAWLYSLLKIAGGLYLIYLAAMVWRHAPDPVTVSAEGAERQALWPAFRTAFLTQIANPKVVVFFGSIFVSVLPANPPLWVLATILAIVLINEMGWYAVVALLFSAPRPRTAYMGVKPWVDRLMAAVLGALGAKLIWDARG